VTPNRRVAREDLTGMVGDEDLHAAALLGRNLLDNLRGREDGILLLREDQVGDSPHAEIPRITIDRAGKGFPLAREPLEHRPLGGMSLRRRLIRRGTDRRIDGPQGPLVLVAGDDGEQHGHRRG